MQAGERLRHRSCCAKPAFHRLTALEKIAFAGQ